MDATKAFCIIKWHAQRCHNGNFKFLHCQATVKAALNDFVVIVRYVLILSGSGGSA